MPAEIIRKALNKYHTLCIIEERGKILEWLERMNIALKYIEENLRGMPDPKKAAEIANSSEFHFQRLFHMITGYSLGEYVRNRRLSLAAQEVLQGKKKIIDIALDYCYESPEAFTRAYTRLHGMSPRDSRKPGSQLKFFSPITFSISIKGETSMDYRIEKKGEISLLGKGRLFSSEDGANLRDIPLFWQESMGDGSWNAIKQLSTKQPQGILKGSTGAALCYKETDTEENWSYMICAEGRAEDLPASKGFEHITISPQTWAIFTSRGALPGAIQEVWKNIFSDWFPTSKYEHAPAAELEVYLPGDTSKDDYICEVWIPVIEKN
jgi:AraC family transcriptional regulator